MKKNILQMLERSAEKYPNRTAFSDADGEISYQNVVAGAKAIGSYLLRFGKEREAVAVIQTKRKENLVGFMGIVYSGNFYVPIDAEMPNDRIALIFETLQPFAVIVDNENLEKVKALECQAEIIRYEEAVESNIQESGLEKIRKRMIDTDPVYALFTSGSTGVPRGVICCHRSVIDYADWLIDTFKLDEQTKMASQAPFYFSMSVLDIYATIRSGAELHVVPSKLFALPLKLVEYLKEKEIDTIYWVPTALCMIANFKVLDKVNGLKLKRVMFAGEAMPTKQLNMWRRSLPDVTYINLFGPTEITDIGLYYIVDREFSDEEPLPIGNTCDNVDALILNGAGEVVNSGEVGELYFRGSFLAHGYYNNAEKTKESFVQNPLNENYPEIIYKTGDLVSINERGEFLFHGRKDFQIKHRGYRIELGEIENAANTVPNMEMCACIYDSEKEKIILFYQGVEVTDKNIRDYMSEKVPKYMLPNVMIKMDNIPQNQNGKMDRKFLKAFYKERKLIANLK